MSRRLICVSCCAIAAALPATASATSPGTNGALAFTLGNDQPAQQKNLVEMRPDGLGVAQLTGLTEVVNDLAPVFSPDGNHVAIGRCMPLLGGCGGGIPIWIMNADGSGGRLLTSSYDGTASWSPDGTQLTFLDDQPEQGVYVINADGTNRHLLIKGSYGGTGTPTWSPDGTRIAFFDDAVVGQPSALGLYLVDVAGDVNDASRKHLLLANDAVGTGAGDCNQLQGYAFDWSPDGSKLLYHCVAPDGFGGANQDIAAVDAASGQVARVVATPGASLDGHGLEWFPRWSPDGTKIVYERESQIWTANADGSDQTALHTGYRPSWQPCVGATVRCGPPAVTGGGGQTPIPDGGTPLGPGGTSSGLQPTLGDDTTGLDACPLADGPASNRGCPLNAVTLGAVKATHRGTIVPVTVPGPGAVTIARTRLTQRVSRRAAAAGVVRLTIKPTPAGRRALATKGRITAVVPVTFTPVGGIARTTKGRFKLIR